MRIRVAVAGVRRRGSGARTRPRIAYVGSFTSKARNARGEGLSVFRVDPATRRVDAHPVARRRAEPVVPRARRPPPVPLRRARRHRPGVGLCHRPAGRHADARQSAVHRRRESRPPRARSVRALPRRGQLRRRQRGRRAGEARTDRSAHERIWSRWPASSARTGPSRPSSHPHQCPFDPGGTLRRRARTRGSIACSCSGSTPRPGSSSPPTRRSRRRAPAPGRGTSASTRGCRSPGSSTSSTRPSRGIGSAHPGRSSRFRSCRRFRRPSPATTPGPASSSRRPGGSCSSRTAATTASARSASMRRTGMLDARGVGADRRGRAALHRCGAHRRAALRGEPERRHCRRIRHRRGHGPPAPHGPRRLRSAPRSASSGAETRRLGVGTVYGQRRSAVTNASSPLRVSANRIVISNGRCL